LGFPLLSITGLLSITAAPLLEGLDWRRVHEARETATPMQPG
jgi:hypothetical protein